MQAGQVEAAQLRAGCAGAGEGSAPAHAPQPWGRGRALASGGLGGQWWGLPGGSGGEVSPAAVPGAGRTRQASSLFSGCWKPNCECVRLILQSPEIHLGQ